MTVVEAAFTVLIQEGGLSRDGWGKKAALILVQMPARLGAVVPNDEQQIQSLAIANLDEFSDRPIKL